MTHTSFWLPVPCIGIHHFKVLFSVGVSVHLCAQWFLEFASDAFLIWLSVCHFGPLSSCIVLHCTMLLSRVKPWQKRLLLLLKLILTLETRWCSRLKCVDTRHSYFTQFWQIMMMLYQPLARVAMHAYTTGSFKLNIKDFGLFRL